MNFGLKLAAIAAILSSTSFANAETVAPDDVKLTDGVIAASLTGEEGDPEEGALIFASKKLGNCLACHANTAMKDQLFHGDVGPPLDGVGSRWEAEEIRAIIVDSKAVFGDQTVMPGFYSLKVGLNPRKDLVGKTILSAEQVEDVVAYLATLKE